VIIKQPLTKVLNVFHTILSKLSMQDIFVPARGGVLLNYIYYMFYFYERAFMHLPLEMLI
jgi:hypothetical protein